MKPYLVVSQFARVVAVVIVAFVIAVALIRSRRDEATQIHKLAAHGGADDWASELARHCAVTAADPRAHRSCRCIRADNRLDDAQPEGLEQGGE